MKYKLIALDLDGTLTNSQKKITDNTKAVLKRAEDEGARIVLASGRPVQGVRALAEELDLKNNDGYIMSLNGGLLISCRTGEVIHDMKVNPEYIPEIYELAKKHKVNLMTYEDDDIISEDIDDKYLEIERRINSLGVKKVDNLLEHITFPVNKFLMLGDGDYLAEVEKDVHARLKDRMEVYRSEPFFLEILPMGVNKAKALETLIDKLGITREEIVAFGDGYNDLTMIEYAGTGVAMANANDVVKSKADMITLSNDEDGVAVALNKFMTLL